MKRTRTIWPLALVLALGMGIGFVMGGSTRTALAEGGSGGFEYRVEAVTVAATRQYEQVLRKYRDDGWRLVEVEGTFLFFERAR